MGGFAIEFGEIFHSEKLFDVLCSDLGDDRDESVDPRPVDLDVAIWLEIDGYVEVDVPFGGTIFAGGSSVGLRHVDSPCFLFVGDTMGSLS